MTAQAEKQPAKQPVRRRGRPSRAEASAKAQTAAAAAAEEPAKVDPTAILEQIAADTSAPATARVAACRALLAQPERDPGSARDPITDLALKLLKGGR